MPGLRQRELTLKHMAASRTLDEIHPRTVCLGIYNEASNHWLGQAAVSLYLHDLAEIYLELVPQWL